MLHQSLLQLKSITFASPGITTGNYQQGCYLLREGLIMEIWFKQFESHSRQILVEKFEDSETEKTGIKIRWQEDLGEISIDLCFSVNDDNYEHVIHMRDDAFDKINQTNIDNVVDWGLL
ncbi:hypothetical protein [Photorhabdus luminescens]|uniref:hypothetical protein n=1 Tax=Photorhabdus luminescens TaxID=29488 RepID=UPI002240DF0C|nr:hypothetical protein [Photorhabdus luminescens]MCW7764452.1 hypothetical protein [Photorhabdus luminescens subsp. venezuelensis]